MITLLVEAGVLAPGRQIQLEESERHHLKVRRARDGERVRLLDGFGGTGEGTLMGPPTEASIHIDEFVAVPPPVRRGLAVAAGDRDRFGWLVEKAAELGVTEVIPLETERTAGVATRIREQHIERLQRLALSAIKQSGAAWAPAVQKPMTIGDLAIWRADGVRWLADAGGEPTPTLTAFEPAVTAVGPEGGFTDGERALLERAGWKPVRLGKHVLRFETAAVVAAALMSRDS